MTERGGLQFEPKLLAAALAEIPSAAWSLASTYSNTRVHHGYRRVVLVSAGQHQGHAAPFGFVWDQLAPIWDAWLSWIDPGGFIIPHRDAGPWHERWQIPIAPSGHWHADETFAPRSGDAFTVKHWEPHAVTNRSTNPRIHLVVDRDVRLDRDPLPFNTFPIPVDMADMIERTQL